MINHDLKLLHIDICKNAGTTINHAYRAESNKFRKYSRAQHISFLGKHHSVPNYTPSISSEVTEQILQDYTVFCVSRNPFDRMVSLWKWGTNCIYKGSFERMINGLHSGKLKGGAGGHHRRSQLEWISDKNGQVRVDHILRYERGIQSELDRLHEILGFPKIKVSRMNTGSSKGFKDHHYSHYYNNDLIQKVQDMFQDDLDYFGYCFEGK